MKCEPSAPRVWGQIGKKCSCVVVVHRICSSKARYNITKKSIWMKCISSVWSQSPNFKCGLERGVFLYSLDEKDNLTSHLDLCENTTWWAIISDICHVVRAYSSGHFSQAPLTSKHLQLSTRPPMASLRNNGSISQTTKAHRCELTLNCCFTTLWPDRHIKWAS